MFRTTGFRMTKKVTPKVTQKPKIKPELAPLRERLEKPNKWGEHPLRPSLERRYQCPMTGFYVDRETYIELMKIRQEMSVYEHD
jgi:hypothetical protein